MTYPTPHFEKLTSVLENDKLPESDKPKLEEAVKQYRIWIANLEKSTKAGITKSVQAFFEGGTK